MNTIFAAFDVFPVAKGSTTRIAHTLHALKNFSASLTLACLGYGDMPKFQEEEHISIRRCLSMHPNFLKRTELFGDFLFDVLDSIGETPDVIHFRDIWSGIPLLEHQNTQSARKIFEVNGFLSIELPMHYPRLYQNPILMNRIRTMEDYCLAQADQVITVSWTNANYIRSRQVAAEKITVIPNIAKIHSPLEGGRGVYSLPQRAARGNTVDLRSNLKKIPPNPPLKKGGTCSFSPFSKGGPGRILVDEHPSHGLKSTTLGSGAVPPQFILYAGTLTPWQGITTLIKAFALIADRAHLLLMLACSTKKFLRPIRKQIRQLHLQNQIETKIALSREHLDEYYQKAVFTVVPLSRCDRNELQGCCPLKILESMAVGTPVIASDIAVCRELVEHGTDGWLVTPDSPRALAQAMLTLLDSPDLVSTLGQRAQQKIIHHYNRETFTEKLREVYLNL